MPNPMENNMVLYYLSGLGSAIGGEGSVAEQIGGMTQQQIGTQNYMELLKSLLAGGGKLTMDKETTNIKAPTSLFGGGDKGMQLPGAAEDLEGITGVPTPAMPTIPTPAMPTELINPSASPLDISGAGLAGLTPEDITQALQLKFGAEEIRRKTIADISEAAYRKTAIGKMEAETVALTPSITVPGFGTLTREEALDWYRTASKDERATGVEYYEYYVAQEKAARTPASEIKSFEDWFMEAARASGGIPEFARKRRLGKEIDAQAYVASPGFGQDVISDLSKASDYKYVPDAAFRELKKEGYTPEQAESVYRRELQLNEMASQIQAAYVGRKVVWKEDGWYVDGKLIREYP